MGKKSNDERPLNERHLLLANLQVSGASIHERILHSQGSEEY
jgi:hypothetical protein